ncbi:hypothetical protein CBR_g39618 [Chara braunii]|uniref:Uncharacterized protein n=1 Tax=Chara braunii TaxID=69332 RepID=A0A388K1J9_CHABU|nr:hypothetical protein CBR_g39618 [Chara braunii]|eukprot:GBG63833.1 hypothetical protein CBR_g39618 [Chara braunii]
MAQYGSSMRSCGLFDFMQERDAARAQMAEARAVIEAVTMGRELWEQKCRAYEEEVDEAKREIKELGKSVEVLTREKQHLEKKCAGLEKDLKELHKRVAAGYAQGKIPREAAVLALTQERDSLRRAMIAVQDNYLSHEERLKELELENDTLKENAKKESRRQSLELAKKDLLELEMARGDKKEMEMERIVEELQAKLHMAENRISELSANLAEGELLHSLSEGMEKKRMETMRKIQSDLQEEIDRRDKQLQQAATAASAAATRNDDQERTIQQYRSLVATLQDQVAKAQQKDLSASNTRKRGVDGDRDSNKGCTLSRTCDDGIMNANAPEVTENVDEGEAPNEEAIEQESAQATHKGGVAEEQKIRETSRIAAIKAARNDDKLKKAIANVKDRIHSLELRQANALIAQLKNYLPKVVCSTDAEAWSWLMAMERIPLKVEAVLHLLDCHVAASGKPDTCLTGAVSEKSLEDSTCREHMMKILNTRERLLRLRLMSHCAHSLIFDNSPQVFPHLKLEDRKWRVVESALDQLLSVVTSEANPPGDRIEWISGVISLETVTKCAQALSHVMETLQASYEETHQQQNQSKQRDDKIICGAESHVGDTECRDIHPVVCSRRLRTEMSELGCVTSSNDDECGEDVAVSTLREPEKATDDEVNEVEIPRLHTLGSSGHAHACIWDAKCHIASVAMSALETGLLLMGLRCTIARARAFILAKAAARLQSGQEEREAKSNDIRGGGILLLLLVLCLCLFLFGYSCSVGCNRAMQNPVVQNGRLYCSCV